MLFNGIEKVYHVQPSEGAWRAQLGLLPEKPAKSGACQTRIMSDREATAYDVPLAVVRSTRSKKAAATRKARKAREASPERIAQAETVEALAETGEQVTA